MKRFYPILLVLSMFRTTLAQSSSHYRDDNKEFEARLVRVFEWVLDAGFSASQREELSRLVDSARRLHLDQAHSSTPSLAAQISTPGKLPKGARKGGSGR